MNELLEKARRDYPHGTNFRSMYDGELTHNSSGVIDDFNGSIYVKDEYYGWWRCIYDKEKNKWAEIIKEETTLLEKAKRDYPIGTKFKSVFTLIEHICDGYYEILNKDVYVKEYGSNMVRCIYRTKTNQWAEIIKENTMTQQEFNALRVGQFISQYEIIHKYNEFLIVKCDNGHDLFDLAKINKLGLKVQSKTFMGLEIKKYDNVPCEANGNTLLYLVEVDTNVIWVKDFKQGITYKGLITSIRLL